MTKHIHVPFSDREFKFVNVERAKTGLSWHDFVLMIVEWHAELTREKTDEERNQLIIEWAEKILEIRKEVHRHEGQDE